MSENEIIDIYDEHMNLIGTAPREQAHREGLWHKAFHCWIVKRASDGHHRVLLQLRSKKKADYPNTLDISAAGHLSAGETAKDGIRKIKDELGIDIDFNKLVKLFTVTSVSERNGWINHEFNPTYLLETDQNLSELKMQPDEIDGVLEATVEDLQNLFNHKVSSVYVSGILLNKDGSYVPHTGSVGIKDFTPHNDSYYVKVMTTVKRYFEGKKALES